MGFVYTKKVKDKKTFDLKKGDNVRIFGCSEGTTPPLILTVKVDKIFTGSNYGFKGLSNYGDEIFTDLETNTIAKINNNIPTVYSLKNVSITISGDPGQISPILYDKTNKNFTYTFDAVDQMRMVPFEKGDIISKKSNGHKFVILAISEDGSLFIQEDRSTMTFDRVPRAEIIKSKDVVNWNSFESVKWVAK